jgi:exonuclease III
MLAFTRATNKSGVYFLSKDELKSSLGLTELQVYYCFKVFSVQSRYSNSKVMKFTIITGYTINSIKISRPMNG